MFDKVEGTLWYVKWALATFLLAVAVDILYVFWPYPAMVGVPAFRATLEAETALVDGLVGPEGRTYIQKVQALAYRPTFVWTGLDSFLVMGDGNTPPPAPDTRAGTGITVAGTTAAPAATDANIGRSLARGFWPQIQVAYIGLLLFAQRVAVLAMSAPIFGIVVAAAVADGILGWYRRRTSVGRESGFIFHRAKHFIRHTVLWLWALYLLPPVVANPAIAIPTALGAVALATRLAVGYFKKYI